MIKKRIMDEEKENEYERKKLNPYSNSTSENKYKKKSHSEKSSYFQFYLIIILICFLIYHILFPLIGKKEYNNNEKENNSCKFY